MNQIYKGVYMKSLVSIIFFAMIFSSCSSMKKRDCNRESNNEAVVRNFLNEVVTKGKLELLDELWTKDMLWSDGTTTIKGLENFRKVLGAVKEKTFENMQLNIKDVVTSKDKVVVRFTNSGKLIGTYRGYKPTFKRAEWIGIGIYRLENGKIAEAWFAEDYLSQLLQLGIVKLKE